MIFRICVKALVLRHYVAPRFNVALTVMIIADRDDGAVFTHSHGMKQPRRDSDKMTPFGSVYLGSAEFGAVIAD